MIERRILRDNEISPRTAYNWFLLLRTPEEVLSCVHKNEIGIDGLIRVRNRLNTFKEPERECLGEEILKDIVKIVRVM